MSRRRKWLAVLVALVALAAACHPGKTTGSNPPHTNPDASVDPPPPPVPEGRLPLRDGWTLQSSAKLAAGGAELSTPGFATTGWVPTSVPSTVLAALVANGVYPDPFAGDNLRGIPREPFQSSWWYRTEVELPADFAGQTVFLDLEGVNYKANVWLNGQLVAGADQVIGTFTRHEFDVTALVRTSGANALAIETFMPDTAQDLALSWLDWNNSPPDRDMGLWQPVYLARSGQVAVRDTRVSSRLDASYASAALTIKTDLHNTSAASVHATVHARVDHGAIDVVREVDLAGHETRTITFDPSTDGALALAHPRLWWPAQLGNPELYDLDVSAEVGGKRSDREGVRFGVREVTFDILSEGVRVFEINGKRVLIRGGGWSSDMLLRPPAPAHLDAEMRYVLDLGLNTIRLEGKLEFDEFYDRADELGILTMPGWMCCDRWEHWDDWNATDHRVATASLDAQARRLRNHPSVITFLIGSDNAPPPDVEQEYLGAMKKNDWPNPVMPSASGDTTPSLGPSGVKMNGPYDWIAPAYWYQDTGRGGAFGFNTETGPGPSVPELESLRVMLTPEALDTLWRNPGARQWHAGTEGTPFDNLGLFAQALTARHGPVTSLEDFVAKAQLMNYEGERAEYEAYGRNKYATATGVIHWLLNNSWPSLIWHLYGHDLQLAGAYYGAKKANEPLHIQYSYDDQSIVVVNHTPRAESGLQAAVRVYGLDAQVRFSKDVSVDIGEDAAKRIVTLPAPGGSDGVYFVDLTLARGAQLVSRNFYWLSRKEEIIDWAHSDFFHTATAQFGDFTALATLPAANLVAQASFDRDERGGIAHVTLENHGATLAFFVRLKLTRGAGGAIVAPVFWQDNYVTLAPGEQRQLDVRYATADLHGAAPAIELRGWNVASQALHP
jgi:exo-1,4-beta-D-glucosaminidase